VSHHHPAGVARQALGRSSWNASAVLEDRLAGLIGVGEDLGTDVDHHLVALARGAGIEAVVQGRAAFVNLDAYQPRRARRAVG